MNKTGINRVMDAFGITENTPTRIKELKSINFRSNGNQAIDSRTDELTFDVDNELIKIKEYTLEPINGFFVYPEYDGETTLSFIKPAYIGGVRFRPPKVGDTLAAVRRSDNIISSSATIVSVSSTKIEISKKLTKTEGCYFTYMDSNLLDKASTDIIYPRLKVIYTPITKFTTDIYIGFNAIVGFSTRSEYAGI